MTTFSNDIDEMSKNTFIYVLNIPILHVTLADYFAPVMAKSGNHTIP